MYAIVKDNTVIKIITNPINVTLPCGDTVTDLRLLSYEERCNHGVYDYIKSSAPPAYKVITAQEYVIDNTAHTVTLTYTLEDVDLAILKTQTIANLQTKVSNLLKPTNYDVLESLELGTTLDTDISTYRAAVRQTLSDATTAINALTTAKDVYEYQAQFPDPLDANA